MTAPFLRLEFVQRLGDGRYIIRRTYDLKHPDCPVIAIRREPFRIDKDATELTETVILAPPEYRELVAAGALPSD